MRHYPSWMYYMYNLLKTPNGIAVALLLLIFISAAIFCLVYGIRKKKKAFIIIGSIMTSIPIIFYLFRYLWNSFNEFMCNGGWALALVSFPFLFIFGIIGSVIAVIIGIVLLVIFIIKAKKRD